MLLNKIKADQLAARKAKDGLATALLTTLIGDAEMVGKNAGRLVTDEEVVAVIKKFIKNIDFGIASTKDVSNIDGSADYYVNQLKEKSILEQYLPQQLDMIRLKMVITDLSFKVGKSTSAIMKELKAQYAGKYDGKMASDIVKSVVAQ